MGKEGKEGVGAILNACHTAPHDMMSAMIAVTNESQSSVVMTY